MRSSICVLLAVIGMIAAPPLFAGAFFPAGSANDAAQARIVHPNGYTGQGGVVTITVCADPASPFAQEMVAPLMRAVDTWDALVPQNGNVDPMPTVPADVFDVETVLLHEIGHCAGLGHPNLNIFGALVSGFTNSGDGPDGGPDIDNGDDDITGSADDERGDDVNANWFRRSDNHPFLDTATIDASTYSRDIADLPAGDNFAANANESVARNIFSILDTEAVMFSGVSEAEEKRSLAFDDVAALRYGMSGLDEMAGTTDDYTTQFAFVGLTDQCQIVVRFVPLAPETIGRCADPSFFELSPNHLQLGAQGEINLNANQEWFFGDAPDLVLSVTDGDATVSAGGSVMYTMTVENQGQQDPTGPAEVVTTVPQNTTFDQMQSSAEWSCVNSNAGSPCTASIASLPAGGMPVNLVFMVGVDDPLDPSVTEIAIDASITAPGGEATPSDNMAMDTTPVVLPPEIFDDDFESGDTSAWSSVVP